MRRGAAFRAMALVLACWAMGRMAWNGFFSSPSVQSPARHAQNGQKARLDPKRATRRMRMATDAKRSAARAENSSDVLTRRAVYAEGFGIVRTTVQAGVDADGMFTPVAPWPAWGGGLQKDTTAAALPANVEDMSFDDQGEARSFPADHGRAVRSRWSGYSYLYWREGSAQKTFSPLPSYGGSQFFARLGYRVSSAPEIEIYGRYASALEAPDDKEFAGGIEITPFKLPVHLHFERRLRDNRGDANAVFVSGGLARDVLPLSATVSLYGQAGAIFGGPQGTLEFYDGQAELRFPVIAGGKDIPSLELGPKLSSGGQGSDYRIDIGPVLRAHIPVGSLQNSLSIGWRERIGGNVEPDSGLALTASIGF